MKKKSYAKYFIILIPIIILMIFSLLNMKNASLISIQYENHFIRQLLWFAIGYGIIIILLFIKPELLFKYSSFFYWVNVLLLILVLFFGKEVNGAKAWFDFGFVSYQPSETMKLTLMLYLCNEISKIKKVNNVWDEIKIIMKIIIITLIPSLLTLIEPDTGAVLIYLIIAFVALLFSKIRKRWFIFFLILLTLGIVAFFYLYFLQQDLFIKLFGTSFFYRIDRLIDFKNGSGMQLENALIAIGVSGTFGSGINNYTLYFPEAPTDFIFALSITNFGFIGALFIVIICFLLDFILLIFALKSKNRKIKIIATSLFGILLFQQLQNILMNIGVMPIIGIPLPFLSYGGTNLVVFFIMIGILIKMLITKEKYPLRIF